MHHFLAGAVCADIPPYHMHFKKTEKLRVIQFKEWVSSHKWCMCTFPIIICFNCFTCDSHLVVNQLWSLHHNLRSGIGESPPPPFWRCTGGSWSLGWESSWRLPWHDFPSPKMGGNWVVSATVLSKWQEVSWPNTQLLQLEFGSIRLRSFWCELSDFDTAFHLEFGKKKKLPD